MCIRASNEVNADEGNDDNADEDNDDDDDDFQALSLSEQLQPLIYISQPTRPS